MAKFEREISSGGVVMQNIDAGIKILLIKDPFGKWTWPKGKIEKGETALAAAKREIQEETGLINIEVISKVGRTDYFYKRGGKSIYKTVDIYLFEFTGKEKLIIQKAEIDDGAWFSEEEAPVKVSYKGAKAIMKRAIGAFKKYRRVNPYPGNKGQIGGKMKRVLFIGLVSIMMSFCANAHGFTVSYDEITTGIGDGVIQQSSIKIKDNKMKREVATRQGKIIRIINNTTAYQYFPSQNKAYKMITKGATNLKELSNYREYLETLDARIIGSENVGDYDCDIYEFTDPGANVRARAWVWRTKNFPVKYELDTASGLITTIMKNVKVNEKIDESEFTVPAKVEIIDMRRPAEQNKK